MSRLDPATERIPELWEAMSLQASNTGKQTNKEDSKKEQNIQELWDYYKRDNKYVRRIPKRE